MRIGVLTAEQEHQEGEIVLSLRQDAGSDFEQLVSSAQFMDEQGAIEEGDLKGSDELPEEGAAGPEPPVEPPAEPRDAPSGPADDAPGAVAAADAAAASPPFSSSRSTDSRKTLVSSPLIASSRVRVIRRARVSPSTYRIAM